MPIFVPAAVFPGLEDASTLKPEIAREIDVMIVRELTGDVYFGQPHGRRETADGRREGFDTMRYDEDEIARIAHVAFRAARGTPRQIVFGGQGQCARHVGFMAAK